MQIPGKSDWSHVYFEATPKAYLLFAETQEYAVPAYAMRYLLPLFEKLSRDLNRSLNVVDLGSSYGIISTLSLYDLTWEELISFYTRNSSSEAKPSQSLGELYSNHPRRNYQHTPNFHLLDISKPAIEFSKQFDLCTQGHVFDIRTDTFPVTIEACIAESDLFLCVGSISYFGTAFFRRALPLMRDKTTPAILVFSTYPLFYYDTCADELESEFRSYGYEFIHCSQSGKGRRMTGDECQNLHQRRHKSSMEFCLFEDEGYLTSTFYMAIPQESKSMFENWLATTEQSF